MCAAEGSDAESGDDDRPLDRAALEARAQRAVAKKSEAAVKIRAVRPGGGPGAPSPASVGGAGRKG